MAWLGSIDSTIGAALAAFEEGKRETRSAAAFEERAPRGRHGTRS
jgi:hypothetical protein